MTAPTLTPFYQVVAVTQPAAGQEWTIRGAGQGLWRVLSLAFTLTTSAAVANRRVRLVADDGTSQFYRSVAIGDQAASLAVTYSGWSGSDRGAVGAGSAHLAFPIGGLILRPGWRLSTLTDLIDVADQYSTIALLVIEYPDTRSGAWVPGLDATLQQEG